MKVMLLGACVRFFVFVITVFIRINAPSLLIPPPFSTFAKFIFWGFTALSTATSLVIPGYRKRCISVLPQSNTAYKKQRKSQQTIAILITDALKSVKIQDKSLQFLQI